MPLARFVLTTSTLAQPNKTRHVKISLHILYIIKQPAISPPTSVNIPAVLRNQNTTDCQTCSRLASGFQNTLITRTCTLTSQYEAVQICVLVVCHLPLQSLPKTILSPLSLMNRPAFARNIHGFDDGYDHVKIGTSFDLRFFHHSQKLLHVFGILLVVL